MKKFTFFLSLLLLITVSAFAQKKTSVSLTDAGLSSDKAYTITCARGTFQAGTTKMEQNATLDATNVNQQFALIPDPADNTKTYLYSVGQQKFLTITGNWGTGITDPVHVFQTGDDAYPYALSFTPDYTAKNLMLNGGSTFEVSDFSNFDSGDKLTFVEVSNSSYSLSAAQQLLSSSVDVTYKVIFNGIEVASYTANQQAGEAAALPTTAQLSYCTYTYDVQTISSSTPVVQATCTFSGPFQIFSSYADVDKWLFLDLKGGNFLYYKSGATPNVQVTSPKNVLDDSQLWAFVGSPYGLQLVNKAAGTTNVLGSKDAKTANDYVILTTADDASYNENLWYVAQSGKTYTGSFYIYNTVSKEALNLQTNVKYWVGGKDYGSEFVVSEPDYKATVKSNIAPYYNLAGQLFGVRQDVYDTYHDRVIAAQTSCTRDEYGALTTATLGGIIYPETGYYRVRTSGARAMGDSYVAYGTGVKNNWQNVYLSGLVAIPASQAAADASSVLKFTKTGYNQYTVSTEGFDIATQPQTNYLYPKGTAATFSFFVVTPGQQTIAIHDDSNTDAPTLSYWHQGGWYTDKDAIVRWSYSEAASHFTLEPATDVTLNLTHASDSKYYATLNLPFAVTLSGATANTLTVSDNEGTLTPVTGTLPQNTPVVLVGDNATATATIVNDVAALSTANVLTGTNEEHAVVNGEIFLGLTDTNVIGFYGWTGTTLQPNRAYIAAGSPAKYIVFQGDATGIHKVENGYADGGNAVRYNLAGLKVDKSYKGVVIVNNKKMIAK